jgi:molybdate-binding protein
LLAARHTAERRLQPLVAALAAEIGAERATRSEAPLELRVAASHDLALAAWADTMADSAGLRVELSFMGSLVAIEEFAAGRADIAGFHVPIAGCATLARKPFLKWLRARRDRLLRFVDREQGLILPRGNPAGVRSLRDVAAKRLRFVNRQRGSGTRLLVDQLLADGRVDKNAIAGYRTEEFTHAAVAATVASGGADAGFGLRAAAAEYRLTFVPLVRERYFLAVRAQSLDSPPIARLLEALRAPAFANLVRSLPGYRTAAAGSIMLLAALAAREA